MRDSRMTSLKYRLNRLTQAGLAGIEPLETRRLFSVPPLSGASQNLGDAIGTDAADPVRNVAYVYDQGANHILAINTSSGTTAFVATPAAAVAGLAVSVDDTRLFASEPTALTVEVFSLPKMTLLKTLNVGVAVNAINGAANDRFVGDTGSMTGFNAETGATLWTEPDQYDDISRTNLAGTMLYTRARGLSGNDGGITAYDMSGTGNPVSAASIPGPTGANSTDFGVDTVAGHAYMGDGGGNGVEVTVLNSGSQTNWTFDGGGSVNGIAAFPGAADMFASTFNNIIGEFDQLGNEVAAWGPPSGVNAESMVVTPNDNVLSTFGTGINITGSSTINVTQTPAPVVSATTFTSTSNSITFGSSLTFDATVTSGGVAPTGKVYFYYDGLSIGGAALSANSTASFTTSALPVGTDSIVAHYDGDAANDASNSSSSAIVVAQTGTVLHVSGIQPVTAEAGAVVTFSGNVSAANSGTVAPTGQVSLYQGQGELGSADLQPDGSFSLPITTLPVGNDSVVVKYFGDGNYTASESSAASVTITPRVVGSNGSSTTLQDVTPNPVEAGATLTMTGIVTSTTGNGAVPTGSVTIFSNNTAIGAAALDSGGHFSFSTGLLAAGTDSVDAEYIGDSTFAISTSAMETVTVVAAGSPVPTSITLTSVSPNPAQPTTFVTIQGTVTSGLSAVTPPSGNVNILDNGVSLGTAVVQSDGSFSLQISGLVVGDDELTAAYAGNTVYAASSSSALSETIAASIAQPSIGKVSLPTEVVASVKFAGSIAVTVTNFGAVSKGKFIVQLFADQSGTLDGNQVLIGAVSKSLNLKNNKSGAVRFALTSLPASLPAGRYHVLAQVTNPANVKSTVVLTQSLEVAEPVIVLSATAGAIAPVSIKAGKAGSILVSITNNGNIDAVGNLDLTLTLASQSVPLVSISPKTRIKAGKIQKVRVKFKLPATLPAGAYTPVIQLSLDGQSASVEGSLFSVV